MLIYVSLVFGIKKNPKILITVPGKIIDLGKKADLPNVF